MVLLLIVVLGAATVIAASAMAGTKKKAASVDVCVLLPDTKSSVRWVQFDAPDFKKEIGRAHV